MSIYPKSDHINLAAIISSVIGAFPWQFMFETNKSRQNAYRIYTQCMLGSCILVTLSGYLELYFLCSEETVRLYEIFRNLSFTFIYTTTVARQMFMRLKPEFRNIMKLVIDTEKLIVDTRDETVTKILSDCAKSTRQKIVMYSTIVFCACMTLTVKPFFATEMVRRGNETIVSRSFPLSVWLPFDKHAHFWMAYITNSLYLINTSYFATSTEVLIFALITYPTGQLRILHHMLRNFEDYKRRTKRDHNVDDDVVAFVVLKKCILMHQDIIKYIDNFNESMSKFMMFDFIQSSVQLSAVLSQFIGFSQMTLHNQFFMILFITGKTYRVTMYCYYPNEILFLSENLPLAVWESNWYEQSAKTKKMMQIMMMRCVKPLQIKIGPFGHMNLDSLVTIFKASYSYMMLIYNTNAQ